jgi:hypothetical protein
MSERPLSVSRWNGDGQDWSRSASALTFEVAVLSPLA